MDAAEYFRAKLALETDPSDVHAAFEDGTADFVLIDTRDERAWNQGHARGAVHMPKPDMPARIPEYPAGTQFVVYCWGPGCNGGDKAALIISELGYPVRLMLGGFEYWAREGLPVDAVVGGATVDTTRAPDPLTAVAAADGHRIACDC